MQTFKKNGTYTAIHPTGDKVTRAGGVAPVVSSGNLWLIEGASYVSKFITELCDFPNGTNDDQVDGLSGAHEDLTIGPVAPPPPAIRRVPISGFA